MRYLILFSLIVFFTESQAQVDRTIGNSQYKRAKTTPAEKLDPVEASLEYLKKELTLDSFQEAAIKVYLQEHHEASNKAVGMVENPGDLNTKLTELIDKLNSNINSVLGPEQKEKFKKIQDKTKKKS